jgi:sortase B
MRSYSESAENGAEPYRPAAATYQQRTGSLRFQQILVFLENLRSQNSDTYGYIYIDGTKINFPVVQTTDNSYYLHYSFERQNLKSGTIFADYRNSRTIERNRNLVLYGHNLSNGGMFHHVVDMLKEENFYGKTIQLTTFDGIYTFTPFSIYRTVDTGEYYRVYFAGDEDFLDWLAEEEARSLFHVEGLSFSSDSVVLTLSTCISGTTNGRYALHGLLTEVES